MDSNKSKKLTHFLVGCFYKPPETSKYLQKNYNELLFNDVPRVLKQNNETIILGELP